MLNNGFASAVVVYLLWERYHISQAAQREREGALHHLEKVIKVDLVNAIQSLKEEIIKLNFRANEGRKA